MGRLSTTECTYLPTSCSHIISLGPGACDRHCFGTECDRPLHSSGDKFFLVSFLFCFSLLGPSSATRKGFWFAHTCASSLYLFSKTLVDFSQLKMKSTQR